MRINSIKNLKYTNGFTLAEVLITLVIIGIIAAMTIPTLMKNTQKQEFVTGLKKANSTLQQAMINMARNNDSSPGDYSFLNVTNFMDEMAKVTNVIKRCNTTAACLGNNYNTTYRRLSNNPTTSGIAINGKGIITADGIIYVIVNYNQAHGQAPEDNAKTLGYLVVDVNGLKEPNIWGRDVFLFDLISDKGLVPGGSFSDSDCNLNGYGFTCAAKVLKENAINY